MYCHFQKRSLFLCFWCNGIHVFSEDLQFFWIPCDFCSPGGIIPLPFICPSSDYCSTSPTSTYPTFHPHITCIRTNLLLKQSSEHNLPTYIRCYIHITPLSRISCIPNSSTISLSRLTPCVQIVPFLAHACIFNNSLVRIFTIYLQKVLKQISASTLTHVLWCRTFIMNGL